METQNAGAEKFRPRIRAATTTQSPDVESIIRQLSDGTYYVPDYQRDSSQWDLVKRSLFIDSLINGLTVPPIIAYPETDVNTGMERKQIVDGQQRLTTIQDFLNERFALALDSEVEYSENIGPLIQGRTFHELPQEIQKFLNRYTINILLLPANLDLGLRLEIFRRINEQNVPLSAQDLRLAVFGQSDRGYFIRLAGIFDPDREGSRRMISAAREKYQLEWPWQRAGAWKSWWDNNYYAGGQSPSQMFLYYVIARDLAGVQQLVESQPLQNQLGIKYDRTTTSVLDLYLAQVQNEFSGENAPKLLAPMNDLLEWFTEFESWFKSLKETNVPDIATSSSTKVALFIAGAVNAWKKPEELTENQWQLVHIFLTSGPGKIREAIGLDYPTTRGKWPGQKVQIDRTMEICNQIARR